MRLLTLYILALFVSASCQTPPPPKKEAFDDEVIVENHEPTPDAGTPDASATELPDATIVTNDPGPNPNPSPDTFVAKPELPKNMSFQETALARTVQQVRMGLVFSPILDGGCGIPTAIRATAEPNGAGYTVDSCSRAVDAAHALTYERHNSRLGILDVSGVSIRHDGEVLWSAAADCTNLRQSDSACASDFIVRRPTAMSFVGPILSYHLATESATNGGPPRAEKHGVVIDVRTGLSAKLGALIDEDSLRDGLKRSSFMRRTVNPTQLDAAKKLDDIWKLWRTQDFAYFGGYYFAGWDAKNGLVDIRIWYLEDLVDNDPNALKELSVWVAPKAQWKSDFEDAAAGTSGFLARDR